MSLLTLDQLKTIMIQVDAESAKELDGEILDIGLDHLGFDSLAVLEIATRIQQAHQLPIPDEAIEEMTTPRNILDYVNQRLAA
ncbi:MULTISPECIES: acyl carrier protein [unclassified Nonomuraea]|uniref:acyl carrier protein n=1 Tax=unclassified Nonomuraea TaxID=2593643 RepID=UPI0035C2092E